MSLDKMQQLLDAVKDLAGLEKSVAAINETQKRIRELPCLKHPELTLVAVTNDGEGLCAQCLKERELTDDGTKRQLGEDTDADGSVG